MYPRDDKFNHAAVFPMIQRVKLDGKITPSAAAMVCNFDKPTKDKPSLLYHSDVVTFFHEFGHVMHNICTESNHTCFSGTNVERDFVELPSQMLENWMWNKDVIRRVAKHYENGETLSDEVIDNKIKIKNLNGAQMTLNQLFYGTFDLLLHTANDQKMLDSPQEGSIGKFRNFLVKKDGRKVDTESLWHILKRQITGLATIEGTNPAGAFGHILGGYESAYYGYLWS